MRTTPIVYPLRSLFTLAILLAAFIAQAQLGPPEPAPCPNGEYDPFPLETARADLRLDFHAEGTDDVPEQRRRSGSTANTSQ